MPARISLHKLRCFDKKYKVYETMRENGGWNAFEFIELEHNNMTEQDAHEHEQRLIDQIQPTMNTYKAWTGLSGLTREEYVKQYGKQHYKQYRIDNKERLQEQHNCECGGKYKTADKSIHFKTEKHKLYIADRHYKKHLFNQFKLAVKQNV